MIIEKSHHWKNTGNFIEKTIIAANDFADVFIHTFLHKSTAVCFEMLVVMDRLVCRCTIRCRNPDGSFPLEAAPTEACACCTSHIESYKIFCVVCLYMRATFVCIYMCVYGINIFCKCVYVWQRYVLLSGLIFCSYDMKRMICWILNIYSQIIVSYFFQQLRIQEKKEKETILIFNHTKSKQANKRKID